MPTEAAIKVDLMLHGVFKGTFWSPSVPREGDKVLLDVNSYRVCAVCWVFHTKGTIAEVHLEDFAKEPEGELLGQ